MEATTTDDKYHKEVQRILRGEHANTRYVCPNVTAYHRETGMTIAESVESFMEDFKLGRK